MNGKYGRQYFKEETSVQKCFQPTFKNLKQFSVPTATVADIYMRPTHFQFPTKCHNRPVREHALKQFQRPAVSKHAFKQWVQCSSYKFCYNKLSWMNIKFQSLSIMYLFSCHQHNNKSFNLQQLYGKTIFIKIT